MEEEFSLNKLLSLNQLATQAGGKKKKHSSKKHKKGMKGGSCGADVPMVGGAKKKSTKKSTKKHSKKNKK